MQIIDRITYASSLAAGKRVLDIGGQKMSYTDPDSAFSRQYARISEGASEYRVVDVQDVPGVDYVLDLNKPACVATLRDVIADYRPEVILCMETLEHLNCHFEVMNVIAEAIERDRSTAFITLPNNGNWVINALGWNHDHCIAFFRDIADRFVSRSELGAHEVENYACIQKYLWYWWVVHILAFGQPLSWGFTIRPKEIRK